MEIVRQEEVEALKQILDIATKASMDDPNPVKSTMAILASAYSVAACALITSGLPLKAAERSVKADHDVCLRLMRREAEEGR